MSPDTPLSVQCHMTSPRWHVPGWLGLCCLCWLDLSCHAQGALWRWPQCPWSYGMAWVSVGWGQGWGFVHESLFLHPSSLCAPLQLTWGAPWGAGGHPGVHTLLLQAQHSQIPGRNSLSPSWRCCQGLNPLTTEPTVTTLHYLMG